MSCLEAIILDHEDSTVRYSLVRQGGRNSYIYKIFILRLIFFLVTWSLLMGVFCVDRNGVELAWWIATYTDSESSLLQVTVGHRASSSFIYSGTLPDATRQEEWPSGEIFVQNNLCHNI